MKKEKTQQWTKVKEDTHRKGDEEAEGIGQGWLNDNLSR